MGSESVYDDVMTASPTGLGVNIVVPGDLNLVKEGHSCSSEEARVSNSPRPIYHTTPSLTLATTLPFIQPNGTGP